MMFEINTALLSFLHAFRTLFPLPILVLNSVFLGLMNAENIPVARGIVIAEVFAALGMVWNIFGTFFVACSVLSYKLAVVPCLAEACIIGAYTFIVSVYQAGARHCHSYLDTPFGHAASDHGLPSVQTACGMQTATVALAIMVIVISVGCFFAHIGVAVAVRKDLHV